MIADFLYTRSKLTPNKIALQDFQSGKDIDFLGLENRANKLASYLKSIGIKKTDCIGVLCRNRIEFFELLFACAKIGAILVPFNWRAPPNELLPLINLTKPKAIFYGAQDEVCASEIAKNAVLINFDNPNDYEAKINKSEFIKCRDFWPDDECWYLIFTSGTTGTPKAVQQTYRMAVANAINIGQAIGISPNDRFLNFLPLFHTAGINLHTLPALFNGCKSWVINGFDAKSVLALMHQGEIDCFFGVPQVYLLLSQHEDFEKTNIAKLRHWGCGGAPLPDYLVETFAKRGAIVCNGMGMTETGPTVFMMDCENVSRKIGSVGKAQIMTIARVVDDNFNDCAPNISGNLVFSGANITTGYWNNQAATDEAFYVDKFGAHWLKSGDLAKKDEEGYFYIVGRSKEMFISGGENIYPAEVENVLLGHNEILEAAIIGIDDNKWGEVGIAFIRVNRQIAIDELSQYCRARLAAYKVPKYFVFVDDYPRTAAGKIQKHILKKDYIAKELKNDV
jgi:fatty-acyl-CoA synthase